MIDEREYRRTPISVRSYGDDPQSVDPRVEGLLSMLTGVFDGLRDGCDLPPAEFVIADDLSKAVRDQAGHTVGVEDLSRYDLDRIAGTVVGKTMVRDDANRRIVIVGCRRTDTSPNYTAALRQDVLLRSLTDEVWLAPFTALDMGWVSLVPQSTVTIDVA